MNEHKITKLKNPGRVQSGKDLAERNRKIKEDLKKTQTGQVSIEEPIEVPTKPIEVSNQVSTGTYVVAALATAAAIAVIVYFKSKNQKTQKSIKIYDPFRQ